MRISMRRKMSVVFVLASAWFLAVPALVSNREKRDLFGRIRSLSLGCPAPSREVAFSYFLTPLGKA